MTRADFPLAEKFPLWQHVQCGLFGSARLPYRREWWSIQTAKQMAASLSHVPMAELATRLHDLRATAETSPSLTRDSIALPAMAIVIEAVRRILDKTLFDTQLVAGLVLADGSIAEMQTGEGKTLTTLFPAVLHALRGKGVHVMTTNEYLAERDAKTLAPVLEALGLTAGCIRATFTPDEKRQAYRKDITFGPGYQFGFDYLLDQLALTRQGSQPLGSRFANLLLGADSKQPEPLQRGLACAIVDEVDSVLLDEASTPLIISEPGGAQSPQLILLARDIAERLEVEKHYRRDSESRRIWLTTDGIQLVQTTLDHAERQQLDRPWDQYVVQALQAAHVLQRDIDYVVRDRAIHLVDTHTGRIFSDRTWQEGLHQAVEAKERLELSPARRSVARISRQRLAGLYRHLCGMTGTASGSEREFWQVYKLPIVTIPTRRPVCRVEREPRFFSNDDAKYGAVADSVAEVRGTGRPVLVGTRTIASSQRLAQCLDARGIPFQLLNGTQDADEAAIVARAGQPGMVTLATNMAGRGTDIGLGPGVAEAGGLHVISVEPHESLRVDRQLAGRAARQGDPGSWQCFVAASDTLLVTHGPALADQIRHAAEDDGESRGGFMPSIRFLQREIEQQAAQRRRSLQEQDGLRNDLSEALFA